MRKVAFISVLLLGNTLLFAQDVIYSIGGINEGKATSLDSILFENLDNGTWFSVTDLPNQTRYEVNLITQELPSSYEWHKTDMNDVFKVIKSIPGEINIQVCRTVPEETTLAIYNIGGQQIYSQSISKLEKDNALIINVPSSGVYILNMNTSIGTRSFKVIGSNAGTSGNPGMDLASTAKKTDVEHIESLLKKSTHNGDFQFNVGDSIRISVFLNGYYMYPQGDRISGSKALYFNLLKSNADSTGVSDVYKPLSNGDYVLSEYDPVLGKTKLVLESNTADLHPGDIVTLDLDTTGLIQKVVKTSADNGQILVETEAAYMNDLFVNTAFKLNTTLIEPQIKLKATSSSKDILKAFTDKNGFIHPIKVIYHDKNQGSILKSPFYNEKGLDGSVNIIDFIEDFSGTDLYNKEGDNIHLYIDEGYASLKSDAVFEFEFKSSGTLTPDTKVKKGDLDYFKFYLDNQADFKAKLALDMNYAIEKEGEKKLFNMKKVTAQFFVPPGIFVWITFDCDIFGKYHFDADASLRADWGFESHHLLQAGGTYEKSNDDFTPFSSYDSTNVIYPLNITGEVNAYARLELYPRVDIKFYDFFGPYAEVAPFVEGNYNAALQSQITAQGNETFLAWNSGIDLGLDLRVGTELSFIGLYKREFGPKTINCFDIPVWKSPYHLKLLTDLPDVVEPGSTITFQVKVTESLGWPVPFCPVYIAGDGTFSKQLPITDAQGILTVNWTVGESIGKKTFIGTIYNADKSVNSTIIGVTEISGLAPVAAFTANATSGAAPFTVNFTDQSSNNPTSWSWNFGDGATSTSKNPSHSYTSAGLYTVSLIVSNSNGSDTETKTNYITVTGSGSEESDIVFNPNLTYGNVSDVDGNTYKTIQIGSQTWMAENLKTRKYSDGTNIPLVADYISWSNLTTPGYCWYNNNEATYKSSYGALYNWYTINTGKLCPSGWHVPSDAEWTTLTNYLGGEGVAGGKLKENGTTHWLSPNTNATNETGFTALPGGICNDAGAYYSKNLYGGWWSATEDDINYAWNRGLYSNISNIEKFYGTKRYGFSIRCIKN